MTQESSTGEVAEGAPAVALAHPPAGMFLAAMTIVGMTIACSEWNDSAGSTRGKPGGLSCEAIGTVSPCVFRPSV
jgi:hypothetical protein